MTEDSTCQQAFFLLAVYIMNNSVDCCKKQSYETII